MNDDERAGPPGTPSAPGAAHPAPPAGWVAPAPPPPRGGWAPPAPGDPQPYAAAYVPQPGYAYGPPPPGAVQPTYEPGLGAFSVLPPAARGWNWGAFLFTWIWGLCNGAYVTLWGLLLMFVPGGNIAWAIVCGMNGNALGLAGQALDRRRAVPGYTAQVGGRGADRVRRGRGRAASWSSS